VTVLIESNFLKIKFTKIIHLFLAASKVFRLVYNIEIGCLNKRKNDHLQYQ